MPFFNPQKGIFRAAQQSGPAALAVVTSHKTPYDDEETDLGFLYAYRAGAVDQPDKQFHGSSLEVPAQTKKRPDKELLAVRFDRFASA